MEPTKARAYIIHEGTKRAICVLLLNAHPDEIRLDKKAVYVGLADNVIDIRDMPMKKFQKAYISLGIGEMKPFEVAEQIAREQLNSRKKITQAGYDALEGILKMDTRGKSSEQIRQEVARIAEDLPQGHALRAVPNSYPDRASAIAAYTATRQALFAVSSSTTKGTTMGSKKVAQPAAAAPAAAAPAPVTPAAPAPAKPKKAAKATPAAAAVAAGAAAVAGKKPKADFSGKYVVTGDAAKAKTTEELGMHEASVRTKVLAALMASKAKGGTDYAVLEAAGGDKTRGAVAYLIKRGFIAKV